MRPPQSGPPARAAHRNSRRRMRALRRIIARAWVLSAILAISLFNSASAQVGNGFNPSPLSGGLEARTGWLSVIWGEAQPGPESPTMILMLTDDNGETTPILLDETKARPLGGLIALNHRRVTVRGEWAAVQGMGPSVLQVQSLQLDLSASPLSGPGALETAAVSGPQPWINILCKFSDVSSEPKPLSYFDGLLSGAQPGLDHYWREVSYNNINIVGSGSTGWYTLPHDRAYYIGLGTSSMLTQLFSDCTAAADASVNFPDYVGINLMFNGELDGSAWGGSRYTTLDGQSRFWYTTWEPPWGYANQGVIAHEMGHGFGLPHSSGEYGATYDNQWDVMSDTWSNCSKATDPTYGCKGQHTISYHMDELGWIPAGERFEATTGSATITLEQLALPQTGDYKMAVIPIGGSATHFYTVEARRWAGYDVKLPGEAVIIHDVDTTRGIPAHVLDVDGNGNTGDAGARWTVGETFSDGANVITVSIDSATASGFVVTISLGVAPPPTATATVTYTPTYTPMPPTATPTFTPTNTAVPPTATATSTATNTAAPPTATSTTTATSTRTPTGTATYTYTPLPTATATATSKATFTPLPTATSTSTPLPPTATPTATPTNTPTNTPMPPTATPTSTYTSTALPPTNTSVPPTATSTSTPTNTSVPPTATSTSTPTNTSVPPTATSTSTPVTPTATSTSTPTNTSVPPTATPTSTPVPPTAMSTSTSTSTAFPPTDTPIPPTATPRPTDTPEPTAAATSTSTQTPTATASSTPSATATSVPPTALPTATSVSVSEPEDINQDGRVNVLDVQLCVNVFLGTQTDPGIVARADINGDGAVNVLDVQAIVNAYLRG